jgi:hypothetical protein
MLDLTYSLPSRVEWDIIALSLTSMGKATDYWQQLYSKYNKLWPDTQQ